MSKYTWANFMRYNENPDAKFEELARWIFIRKFNNNSPDLMSSPNNAGIEAEPVKQNGKSFGFQAKYTSATFPYADFAESINKTIARYEGKLDVYVIFCNKKSTKTSKSYIEMQSELKLKNIELLEISGEHLLDYLIKEDDNFFSTQFFDEIILKDSFYTSQVNQAIEDLGGRYHPRINIETEIERRVAFVYKSEKAIESFKKNLIEKCIELETKNIVLKNIVTSKSHLDKIRKILIEFDKCSWKDIEKIHKSYTFLTNECNRILSEIDSKDDDQHKFLRSELYLFLSLLSEFNLINNVAVNSIFRRVVFVYGEAGTGKSHLLAKTALNALEEGHHTLLLLGNQFIEQSPIESQILSLLNITNTSFEEFLDRLNHKGIRQGKRIVIIIDAINESNYNSIWKTFLNKLISSVKNREKVCLIISYRTTFEKLVLSDEVIRKIDSDITMYEHHGFIDITEEAIEKYFEYHKIPYTISMHLEQAFENPLFLVTYCKLWNIR